MDSPFETPGFGSGCSVCGCVGDPDPLHPNRINEIRTAVIPQIDSLPIMKPPCKEYVSNRTILCNPGSHEYVIHDEVRDFECDQDFAGVGIETDAFEPLDDGSQSFLPAYHLRNLYNPVQHVSQYIVNR
jgi:hypothetical protein